MIKYRKGYDIDYIRLAELLCEAGRDDENTRDFKKLVHRVEGSETVVTAWDFDYMVGFARLSCVEGISRIRDVMVDKEFQGQGIGKELVNRILSDNQQIGFDTEEEKTLSINL